MELKLTGGESRHDNIADSIALLKRAEALALRMDPENGFYLAFSGGKDSQVMYHLAKMAGVKFKAFMSLTSIDPPEVIRFVRSNYSDVELIKPKQSIYAMAKKKRILPTMMRRWCCAEYKEIHGAGKVTLVGVRRQESARRRHRQEIELLGHKFAGTFDQWDEHQTVNESCINGKDKIIVSPILDWTQKEVWSFLNGNGIPHCELYDQGYSRIGCILCPMSTRSEKLTDLRRYPHAKKMWLDVIRYLIDVGAITKFDDPELFFRWWISKKGVDQFYADEILQQKIEFENDKNN